MKCQTETRESRRGERLVRRCHLHSIYIMYVGMPSTLYKEYTQDKASRLSFDSKVFDV